MTSIHYFDRDGDLVTYTEHRDSAGNVVSTSGTKPPANVEPATSAEIIAYFSRLLDARRQAHEADQAAAIAKTAETAAKREAHRQALLAAGVPEETALAMFPDRGEFRETTYTVPPAAVEHYASYGLNEHQAASIVARRGV